VAIWKKSVGDRLVVLFDTPEHVKSFVGALRQVAFCRGEGSWQRACAWRANFLAENGLLAASRDALKTLKTLTHRSLGVIAADAAQKDTQRATPGAGSEM